VQDNGPVSPVSRKRRPKRSGQSRPGRRPPAPESLPARLVKVFDSIGADTDPIDVELFASRVLGMVWQRTPQVRPDDEPDALLGLDVVEYAAQRATQGAMALLRSWAALGLTDALRDAATAAAGRLSEAGLAEPPWAARLSQVRVGECWQLADVYGDQAELLCTFQYGDGADRHGLVALLDFNGPGVGLKDVFVADDVPATIRELRKEDASDPLLALTQIEPGRARQLLERALRTMDEFRLPTAPGVSDERADFRALALARCRAMPAPDNTAEAGRAGAAIDQKAIVAEFLASPHARDLPQTRYTRWCVALIVESLVETDPPLRISPALIEDLLDNLSSDIQSGEFSEAEAVPAIVAAWARWSAERDGLPDAAVARLAMVAAELGAQFLEEYGDGADYLEAGLEDIRDSQEFAEALQRRQFAFPYADADLDPADEDSRLELALAEHPEYRDVIDREEVDGANPRLHAAMHAIIGQQLWDGEPPEVWPAAKRLLDAGLDRHEILHRLAALMTEQVHAALSGQSPDIAEYRRKLAALDVPS
jgi:hypothetical protein